MTKKIKTDLLVIGAGAGGLSISAGAAQLGVKVVLLEGDTVSYTHLTLPTIYSV